jgi:hypothetical protein
LVSAANEAVDRDSVRWNARDRRHTQLFERLDAAMPRFQRAAIGVSVIARGLDDHARLTGSTHAPMASMGHVLDALADAIRSLAVETLTDSDVGDLLRALDEVRTRRARCVVGASRRARAVADATAEAEREALEGEWLNYTALLVQVDRIVADLSAPLPT